MSPFQAVNQYNSEHYAKVQQVTGLELILNVQLMQLMLNGWIGTVKYFTVEEAQEVVIL